MVRAVGDPLDPDCPARVGAPDRERERGRAGNEEEGVPDDAPGERAHQVVDEDRVRLGCEGHAPTARLNGITKFTGLSWSSSSTRTAICTRYGWSGLG